MRLLAALLTLTCVLTAHADGQPEDASPLAPLTDVAALLDKGAAAYLTGTPPKDAFPGWKASEGQAVRPALTAAGATALKTFGMELEIEYAVDGKVVSYLRTYVQLLDGKPSLLFFGARRYPADQARAPLGRPLKGVPTEHALLGPVGRAGRALAASLEAGKVPPLLDPTALATAVPSKSFREQLEAASRAARENQAQTLAALKDLAGATRHLRIDDVAFMVYGAQSRPVGMLRADFDFEGDALAFRLGRFRPFEAGK